ncbi:hypothetical protein AAMO2058_001641200, partial [Amorphochlora amoebiformis]
MPDNNVSGDPTKSPGYPAISEMEGRLGTTAGRVGVPHIVFLLVLWGFILLFSIVMTSGNVSSGIGLGGRVKGEGRGGTPLWRQRDIRNMRKHRSLASRRRESLAKPPDDWISPFEVGVFKPKKPNKNSNSDSSNRQRTSKSRSSSSSSRRGSNTGARGAWGGPQGRKRQPTNTLSSALDRADRARPRRRNGGVSEGGVKEIYSDLEKLGRIPETFDEMGLDRNLLEMLEDLEFTTPTEIQSKAALPILKGTDVFLAAETGSGKTLAYLLPVISRVLEVSKVTPKRKKTPSSSPRALILVPTDLLCRQVGAVLEWISEDLELRQGPDVIGTMLAGRLKPKEQNDLLAQ